MLMSFELLIIHSSMTIPWNISATMEPKIQSLSTEKELRGNIEFPFPWRKPFKSTKMENSILPVRWSIFRHSNFHFDKKVTVHLGFLSYAFSASGAWESWQWNKNSIRWNEVIGLNSNVSHCKIKIGMVQFIQLKILALWLTTRISKFVTTANCNSVTLVLIIAIVWSSEREQQGIG